MAHFRFEAGTDTARIGIWDARFTGAALPGDPVDEHAERGDLFYVALGGDGGGPLEVFVDEPIPAELLAKVRTVNRRFLLNIESGTASVGGVEDFGAKQRAIAFDLSVPAGRYALRCHSPDPDLSFGDRAPVVLHGPWRDRALYQVGTWLAVIGFFGLLFSGCGLIFGLAHDHWLVVAGAIAMTLGWLLAFLFSRLPGVQRMALQDSKRSADEPPLIFELTSASPDEPLAGGWISV